MKPHTLPGTVILALVLLLGVPPSRGSASGLADTEIRTAVQELTARFLAAFENLELDQFMACFAPDATVFFPAPEPPQRFDGKAAIRQHFHQVFDAIRKSSTATKPPFHHLNPEDLRIQLVGSDVAVVTFHLRNAERIARRTLVVSRVAGFWVISHLHASNVAVGEEPAPFSPVNPHANG